MPFISVYIYGFPAQRNDWPIEQIGIVEYGEWSMAEEQYYYLDYYGVESENVIIDHIEKMTVQEPFIYVIGQMGYSVTNLNDIGQLKHTYVGQFDGKRKELYFNNPEEMPRYAKINSKTADVEWYNSLGIMNELDRKIFADLESGKYNKKWWNPFD
ncbi:MAG: hypothetical protein Q8O95_03460 [bacterium]|nr:hypothetical protein [bacterium]